MSPTILSQLESRRGTDIGQSSRDRRRTVTNGAPGAFQTRRLTLAVDTPLDELGASRSKTPMPSSPPAETRQDFPRGDRSTPSTRDDALT